MPEWPGHISGRVHHRPRLPLRPTAARFRESAQVSHQAELPNVSTVLREFNLLGW